MRRSNYPLRSPGVCRADTRGDAMHALPKAPALACSENGATLLAATDTQSQQRDLIIAWIDSDCASQ
jgi:hypothetical protein